MSFVCCEENLIFLLLREGAQGTVVALCQTSQKRFAISFSNESIDVAVVKNNNFIFQTIIYFFERLFFQSVAMSGLTSNTTKVFYNICLSMLLMIKLCMKCPLYVAD